MAGPQVWAMNLPDGNAEFVRQDTSDRRASFTAADRDAGGGDAQ
jgi:hypothetical protein